MHTLSAYTLSHPGEYPGDIHWCAVNRLMLLLRWVCFPWVLRRNLHGGATGCYNLWHTWRKMRLVRCSLVWFNSSRHWFQPTHWLLIARVCLPAPLAVRETFQYSLAQWEQDIAANLAFSCRCSCMVSSESRNMIAFNCNCRQHCLVVTQESEGVAVNFTSCVDYDILRATRSEHSIL